LRFCRYVVVEVPVEEDVGCEKEARRRCRGKGRKKKEQRRLREALTTSDKLLLVYFLSSVLSFLICGFFKKLK
jgi:hypothetical protein